MKHTTEHEFKSRGGNWLGAIRSWIQHNCLNGSDVIWGSNEVLRTTRTFTPALLEEIASTVAWAAVKEDRERFSRPAIFELQIRDQKIRMLAKIIVNAKCVDNEMSEFHECPYCRWMHKLESEEEVGLDKIPHAEGCEYIIAKKWLEEVKDV